MKLAEALVERKAAQQQLAALNERLQRVAVVQEGTHQAQTTDRVRVGLGRRAGTSSTIQPLES